MMLGAVFSSRLLNQAVRDIYQKVRAVHEHNEGGILPDFQKQAAKANTMSSESKENVVIALRDTCEDCVHGPADTECRFCLGCKDLFNPCPGSAIMTEPNEAQCCVQ